MSHDSADLADRKAAIGWGRSRPVAHDQGDQGAASRKKEQFGAAEGLIRWGALDEFLRIYPRLFS